jgi:hypothetical protein
MTGGFVVDGKVEKWSSTKYDKTVEPMLRCVNESICTLDFPKPKGGGKVHVHYPFSFDPNEK